MSSADLMRRVRELARGRDLPQGLQNANNQMVYGRLQEFVACATAVGINEALRMIHGRGFIWTDHYDVEAHDKYWLRRLLIFVRRTPRTLTPDDFRPRVDCPGHEILGPVGKEVLYHLLKGGDGWDNLQTAMGVRADELLICGRLIGIRGIGWRTATTVFPSLDEAERDFLLGNGGGRQTIISIATKIRQAPGGAGNHMSQRYAELSISSISSITTRLPWETAEKVFDGVKYLIEDMIPQHLPQGCSLDVQMGGSMAREEEHVGDVDLIVIVSHGRTYITPVDVEEDIRRELEQDFSTYGYIHYKTKPMMSSKPGLSIRKDGERSYASMYACRRSELAEGPVIMQGNISVPHTPTEEEEADKVSGVRVRGDVGRVARKR
jgi:hypothetical protein